jgi:hypothetical protein
MANNMLDKLKGAYNSMARGGTFGSDVQKYKSQDDISSLEPGARPAMSGNVLPYHDHLNNPDKLNSIADQSHQDHKAVTGQIPNSDPDDQGYTTYQHQGAYYQPGSED